MKTKNDIFNERVKDFKSLVIYFCVTRPQYFSYTSNGKSISYKKDGKFSKSVLVEHMNFLNGWNRKSRSDKKSLAFTYANRSALFNYCFGIPSELVKTVLGSYRENGTQHKISIDEVVSLLEKEGFLEVKNAGRKFNKKDGKYEVKCYWTKKYFLKNEKYWFKLLDDDKYRSIKTFPNASDRVKEIIFEYTRSFKEEVLTNEQPVVKAQETQEQQVQLRPITFEQFLKFYSYGGVSDLYFDVVAKDVFKLNDDSLKLIHNKLPRDPQDKVSDYAKKRMWASILKCNIPALDDVSKDTIAIVTRRYETCSK